MLRSSLPSPLGRNTADGRKLPDIHTKPMALRDALQRELGVSVVQLLGANRQSEIDRVDRPSTRYMVEQHDPTLTLSYVPHLITTSRGLVLKILVR